MEQINSVTLRGTLGNARVQRIGDSEIARFSVATEYASRDTSGHIIIDCTWHSVIAFKSNDTDDFSRLVKGASVEVRGRLRNTRYMGNDGVERTLVEIIANQVKVF